jgi:prepilin-type N-terminal cleavage/methylation domain-containing protein
VAALRAVVAVAHAAAALRARVAGQEDDMLLHRRHSGGSVRAQRAGFTLLEVVLATSIGLLLFAALYVAVEMQFRQIQSGRDIIEQTRLARSLLNTMAADLTPTLPAPSPNKFKAPSSQGGGGGGGAGQGSTPTTGAATPSTATQSGGAASGAGSSTVITSNSFLFTVQGTSTQLSVFISRVPRETIYGTPAMASADNQQVYSDLRRITYWLAGSADAPLGLARQEVTLVTSEDEAAVPPDISDEASYVKAEEVKSLEFSYWDGTEWQDSWDGTAAGPDGVTPQGPPLAIAITVGLMPRKGAATDQLRMYRHVVAIPCANGATSQQSGTTGSAP